MCTPLATDILNLKKYFASPSERLVLHRYSLYADSEGRGAFPSYETVAQKTATSYSTVLRAVDHLANVEMLIRKGISSLGTVIYDLDPVAIRKHL